MLVLSKDRTNLEILNFTLFLKIHPRSLLPSFKTGFLSPQSLFSAFARYQTWEINTFWMKSYQCLIQSYYNFLICSGSIHPATSKTIHVVCSAAFPYLYSNCLGLTIEGENQTMFSFRPHFSPHFTESLPLFCIHTAKKICIICFNFLCNDKLN